MNDMTMNDNQSLIVSLEEFHNTYNMHGGANDKDKDIPLIVPLTRKDDVKDDNCKKMSIEAIIKYMNKIVI